MQGKYWRCFRTRQTWNVTPFQRLSRNLALRLWGRANDLLATLTAKVSNPDKTIRLLWRSGRERRHRASAHGAFDRVWDRLCHCADITPRANGSLRPRRWLRQGNRFHPFFGWRLGGVHKRADTSPAKISIPFQPIIGLGRLYLRELCRGVTGGAQNGADCSSGQCLGHTRMWPRFGGCQTRWLRLDRTLRPSSISVSLP